MNSISTNLEIDDALFGLADKAVTDRLQSAYFETMRQIRLERDGLSRAFSSELCERVRAQLETADADAIAQLGDAGAVEALATAARPLLVLLASVPQEEATPTKEKKVVRLPEGPLGLRLAPPFACALSGEMVHFLTAIGVHCTM